MENKFNELLQEPSGEFYNFCRMSYTDFAKQNFTKNSQEKW